MKYQHIFYGLWGGGFAAVVAVVGDNGDVFVVFGNDSRFLKPNSATDRHYTHGTKLVYTTEPDWQWLKAFSEVRCFRNRPQRRPSVGFFW